jgi:hypothetical protein
MAFQYLPEALDTFWGQEVLYVQDQEGWYEVIPLLDLEEWCSDNGWEYEPIMTAFIDLDVEKTAAVMGIDGNIRYYYPADTETEAPPSPSDSGFLQWAEQQSPERLEQFGKRGA